MTGRVVFQSTRPAQGATFRCRRWPPGWPRFNPRAPRRARREADGSVAAPGGFNPRAPRRARREDAGAGGGERMFQSTRPAQGATTLTPWTPRHQPSFNPRAPRRARHGAACGAVELLQVSIHAPRAGRDIAPTRVVAVLNEFQSTRPAQGATFSWNATRRVVRFQSTRPAQGATPCPAGRGACGSRFNPRAPRRARRCSTRPSTRSGRFNPRAPRRARPGLVHDLVRPRRVSIHAPRAGRDLRATIKTFDASSFQSTRPAQGAT